MASDWMELKCGSIYFGNTYALRIISLQHLSVSITESDTCRTVTVTSSE